MKKIQLLFVGALLLFLLPACGAKENKSKLLEEWDDRNDPVHFSLDLDYSFSQLPTSGVAAKQAWPDTYWPSYRGGLANRWHGQSEDPFSYTPPTLAQLRAMTAEEIAGLSPAEKYDVLISNYDYDLLAYERKRTNADDESWFGLCHGWAPAAINYEEPRAVTVSNADGIEIPFGSSDVKALLTFYQQFNRRSSATQFLGGRCNYDLGRDPDAGDRPECRDTNAGTFHVIVTNLLGTENVGFVADVTRDLQVWNQPIHGYESTVIDETDEVYAGAAPGTAKIVTMETVMTYTVESRASWETFNDAEYFAYNRQRQYEYTLELSADGEILGGEWVGGERPDFLWRQTAPEFRGYFGELGPLYQQAIASDG